VTVVHLFKTFQGPAWRCSRRRAEIVSNFGWTTATLLQDVGIHWSPEVHRTEKQHPKNCTSRSRQIDLWSCESPLHEPVCDRYRGDRCALSASAGVANDANEFDEPETTESRGRRARVCHKRPGPPSGDSTYFIFGRPSSIQKYQADRSAGRLASEILVVDVLNIYHADLVGKHKRPEETDQRLSSSLNFGRATR
jgi:hypothetical protein